MSDDIFYCASDCERINCYRNKANITDHGRLHSWIRKEDIPDCPYNVSPDPHIELTLDETIQDYTICEVNGAARNYCECDGCTFYEKRPRTYTCQLQLRMNVIHWLIKLKEGKAT